MIPAIEVRNISDGKIYDNIKSLNPTEKLFAACKAVLIDYVIDALNEGADINNMDDWGGDYPIEFAVDFNNIDIVNYLLQNGANVTNMSLVFAFENKPLLIQLLDHIEKHQPERLNGRDFGLFIDSCEDEERNDVIELIRSRIYGYQNLFAPKDSDEVELIFQNLDTTQMLFSASAIGKLDYVKKALEKGADINHCSDKGEYPIEFAIKNGHTDVVHYLLSKGAGGTNMSLIHAFDNKPLLVRLLDHIEMNEPEMLTEKYLRMSIVSAVEDERYDCLDLIIARINRPRF